jgi:hypothetical protein
MLRCCDKLILVIAVFLSVICSAQKGARLDKKLMAKAEKDFDFGDYMNAITDCEELFRQDSTNGKVNYMMGVCTYELKRYRDRSGKYLKKVSLKKFPEANYYLAELSHFSGNFDEAISYFTAYKKGKRLKIKDHTDKEIDDLIGKCSYAKNAKSNPRKDIEIINLGSAVNTSYPEYAPLIPADESFLIFTSRRPNTVYTNKDPFGDYYEDIYSSARTELEWQAPVILDTAINSDYHDAGTGISADGEKLLSYHTSPDHIHGHIYESSLIDGKWCHPYILNAHVNSEDYIETSACYSKDLDIIFFSSNRPGGYGGKDLYRVKKLPNGNWSAALNLGPKVNTEYDEDSPFIHPSGDLLFFSSQGHKNMGGFDVFRSYFDDTAHFSAPENMGYPLNTEDDDIFFVMNTDASTGYFSSKREGGLGSQDIYKVCFEENNVPLNVYNIHFRDEADSTIKQVDVILKEINKKEVYGIYRSNSQTGKMIIISKPKKNYRIEIKSAGYESLVINSQEFDKENNLVFRLKNKRNE